jgi:signal transduction histidine kinase
LDLKTRKFRHFLKDISIRSVYEDSEGILWVVTGSGLYRSANKDATSGFIRFNEANTNFEMNNVFSLQEDNRKSLWVGTSSGIYRINLGNYESILFGKAQGVNGPKLNSNICQGSNGELYFAADDGYYVISPGNIRLNSNLIPPEIIFSDLRIGGTSVKSEIISPLSVPIEQATEISLKYNQNSFDIDFAGINYSNPDYNRHQFMLQNYDTIFREVHSDKTASYFNVPPGSYIFKVKAASSDGVWAERDMKITITPPWWRTWWAYGFYCLCLLVAIYFTDRIQRKTVIERERAKTRERELAQAKEIEKAYTELKTTQSQLIQSEKMASLGELTAGIAHEIQNPLNFMNNFSEVNVELIDELRQEMKNGNTDDADSIAENIRENELKINHHGKRADSIVKGMLQHSRSSSGFKEPTDINAMVNEYLRLAYHGLRAKDKDFNATIITDFDKSIGNTNIIPQDIGRVLLNLYNNAFYAVSEKRKSENAGYEPTVSVNTKKINDKVEIRVKDNGNGIPQKVIDKIFQPFFTTKPTGQGTGLGLSLSYDIVKAHGGEIMVNTREGKFTEFTVNLPL